MFSVFFSHFCCFLSNYLLVLYFVYDENVNIKQQQPDRSAG